MNLSEKLTNYFPLPLAFVLIFLGLNFAIFSLVEMVFSVLQNNFSQQNISLSNDIILFAVLLSNSVAILIMIRFLHSNEEQFSFPNFSEKVSSQSLLLIVFVLVAFLLFLKYEIVSWWVRIFGELSVDLIPWPFHLFDPEKYDISYLIFFSLIFVLIQPLWEELLFRRILTGSLLKQGFNHLYAVILSATAFSLYLAFYLLVEVSINDLFWFLLANLTTGLILGTLFVYTGRIRYSYIVSSSTNVYLLLLFLSRNHFEFIPYRELILAISQLTLLIGLVIIFNDIIQKVLDGKLIIAIKEIGRSLQTISWPSESNLMQYWIVITVFLPIFPLGVIVFVDHTILYTDLLALILENGVSLLVILVSSFVIYYSIYSKHRFVPNDQRKTSYIGFNWDSTKLSIRNKFSLKIIFRGVRSRIVFILLLFGVISPFYILSITSITKIDVLIFLGALIDVSILIAQNPFFTFQRVVTKIRSNIIFIGNSTEILNQFFLFQQSLGKWNFLPDTYMSSSADWIHGLLTVIIWLSIIILYGYLLKKSKQYPLKAALGAVVLIIMNFFWILLAMGFGSISEGGEPSGMPSLEDMSLLVEFDIQIKEFLILPLGLLLFLIAAIIISIQVFLRRKNRPEDTPIP
ncbi:MAG: CPBP family intramembrane glutamic endopeptidase [Candidatus Hodarchaeales archaeon]|jgi:membrane protease YdiL (CAAX protease family)